MGVGIWACTAQSEPTSLHVRLAAEVLENSAGSDEAWEASLSVVCFQIIDFINGAERGANLADTHLTDRAQLTHLSAQSGHDGRAGHSSSGSASSSSALSSSTMISAPRFAIS